MQFEYEHDTSSFSWSSLDAITLNVRHRGSGECMRDIYLYLHAISV